MAKREPKSTFFTRLQVIGKNGSRMGSLELTSGNFIYVRADAKTETLRLSHQQLIDVLEDHLQHQAFDEHSVKLPKPHKAGDFYVHVTEHAKGDDYDPHFDFRTKSLSLRDFGYRYVAQGNIQVGTGTGLDVPDNRRRPVQQWFAQISIQLAVHLLDIYIEKFLVGRKATNATEEDVVISKLHMQRIVKRWTKRLQG